MRPWHRSLLFRLIDGLGPSEALHFYYTGQEIDCMRLWPNGWMDGWWLTENIESMSALNVRNISSDHFYPSTAEANRGGWDKADTLWGARWHWLSGFVFVTCALNRALAKFYALKRLFRYRLPLAGLEVEERGQVVWLRFLPGMGERKRGKMLMIRKIATLISIWLNFCLCKTCRWECIFFANRRLIWYRGVYKIMFDKFIIIPIIFH